MKNIISIILFFLTLSNLEAQKVWLSGYYANHYIKHLYDGNYVKTPVKMNGIHYKNDSHVVLFGTFQRNVKGKTYFDVETTNEKVNLYTGIYKKSNFNCPATNHEGELAISDSNKIFYASFVPLSRNGNITVTKAEWGIKVCNKKTYGVYYIQEVQNNNSAQNYQLDDEFENVQQISGNIISNKLGNDLDIPNIAIFQAENGVTYYISNTIKPFSVGEKLTLKGHFKDTYYESMPDLASVFYVTEFVDPIPENNIRSMENPDNYK